MIAVLAALSGVGCSNELCEEVQCVNAGGAGGATISSSSVTSSTTATISSTSAVTTECDPLNLTADASISATCGVFVEPGKTAGTGAQSAPFGTLAEALSMNPMNLPIYVCSTGTGLDEAATLSGTERLLGGVTCSDWKASATKTAWTAPTNTSPLTLSSTTGALVQSFGITSAAASSFDGATLQGNSSIAVLADNATATFENVDIVAGDGASGGDATDQTGRAPGRTDLPMSFDGSPGGGCNMPGGMAKDFSTCPAGGGTTEGGKGGDGANGNGAAGLGGLPNFTAVEPNGTPGVGDDGSGGWTCGATPSGNAEFGHDGPNAIPAPAASGTGNLTAAGFLGAAGGAGPHGGIGQGGGGGGGRKKSVDGCSTTGASGGSGGAGGCGGLGGAGGGAGGASIALASINSTLTLTNVHLTAQNGGNGGAGGDGQLGGIGGNGANGGGSACKGGDGGKGGDGAGGGGGKGGPSIGLASVGPALAPTIDDGNITVSATPATGGAPGGGNVPGLMGGAGDTTPKATF